MGGDQVVFVSFQEFSSEISKVILDDPLTIYLRSCLLASGDITGSSVR